jgi:hypothetical protein
MARLQGPWCQAFCWRGSVIRLPCGRAHCRRGRLLEPLSPTTRWGRRWGRPGPRRLTAPTSRRWAQAIASGRGPGVRPRGISGPPPAARRGTVGRQPPRRRPKASASGARFGPPPRVGGLGCWGQRSHGGPHSAGPQRRLALERPPRADSRGQPSASGRSGWPRPARGHRARGAPARELQGAESRACRGECGADRRPDDPCAVVVEGAAVAAAPMA